MAESPNPRGAITINIGGPELSEHYPAFDEAYGKFIRNFGQLETSLALLVEQLTVRTLGGGQPLLDITRALVGARRTPDLITPIKLTVKAIMRTSDMLTGADLQTLEQLFAQLGEIRFLRDRTAHFALSPRMREGQLWWRVYNRWAVKDLDQTEELFFKVEHLQAAVSDMQTIREWMWWTLRFGHPPEGAQRPPWQYKPSEVVKIQAQ